MAAILILISSLLKLGSTTTVYSPAISSDTIHHEDIKLGQ
jgi:hypothetical protein